MEKYYNKENKKWYYVFNLNDDKKNVFDFSYFTKRLIEAGIFQSEADILEGRKLPQITNADLKRLFNNEDITELEDPVSDLQRIAWIETWLNDGYISMLTEIWANFVIGQNFKVTVEINNTDYDDELQKREAIRTMLEDPFVKELKKALEDHFETTQFSSLLATMIHHLEVFGRGALLTIRDKRTNLPIKYRELSAARLARVFVDSMTGEFKAVECLDFPFPSSIIKKEDIVYFTAKDYNILPNTKWFGSSKYQRLVDLSETTRIINSGVLKEINYRLFAPFLIIEGTEITEEIAKNIEAKIKGGSDLVTNLTLKTEVKDISKNPKELTDERTDNNRNIVHITGVPEFFIFNDQNTMANSRQVIQIWLRIIEFFRNRLRDIIKAQIIEPFVKQMIINKIKNGEFVGIASGEMQTPIYDLNSFMKGSQDTTIDEFNRQVDEKLNNPNAKTDFSYYTPVDKQLEEMIDLKKLPFKFTIDFVNHIVEPFLEQVQALVLAKQAGFISVRGAQERLSLYDEIERQQQEEAKKLAGEVTNVTNEIQANDTTIKQTGGGVKMPSTDVKDLLPDTNMGVSQSE